MTLVARNLTDVDAGFLNGMRYLALDNDSLFTNQFKRTLKDAGLKAVNTAYQAPNMNAIAERWVLSAKTGCLDRTILFGGESPRRALRESCPHFHTERPHQGVGNKLIDPPAEPARTDGEVVEHERLGGLLRSYQRAA